MKKLFLALALVAGMTFVSCGSANETTTETTSATTETATDAITLTTETAETVTVK